MRLVRALAVAPREGVSLEDLRARLRSSDRVLRVEDDAPLSISKSANDPGVSEQYAIKQKNDHDIDAPSAWNKRTSCAKVAVLDTGVQKDHPDLKSNLWENTKDPSNGRDDDRNGVIDDRFSGDVVDGKGSGVDKNGHGTHVAGIIGARGNDSRGIAGLCCRREDRRRPHPRRQRPRQLVDGARRHRLRDQSRKSSTPPRRAHSSEIVHDAIQRAKSKGVLVVAAAGNDGANADKKPLFPAAFPDSNILSVAATNSKDKLASFSNFGAKTVDLAAPGKTIASTFLKSDYAYMSGTSMATPYVAAAAAMLRKEHSSWDIGDITSRLRKQGDKLKALKGKTVSGKRLNINRALK